MSLPVSRLITMHALTFLHPGTGQTTGVVDLPVQREVHTGFPMMAASGVKGSLRDKAERKWGKGTPDVVTVFGTQAAQENPAAGALSVTDARILAFPVRSLQHVFVWVTCPMVLKRLQRDAGLVGLTCPNLASEIPRPASALVAHDADITSPLVLEEIQFSVETKKVFPVIAGMLQTDAGFDNRRLVVIPDTDFEYLVNHATQISTRIKLNDRKTTTGGEGNMWVEETLPPETIMYTLAVCHAPRMNGKNGGPEEVEDLLRKLIDDKYLQIGGNETVGQGWCCISINGGDA